MKNNLQAKASAFFRCVAVILVLVWLDVEHAWERLVGAVRQSK